MPKELVNILGVDDKPVLTTPVSDGRYIPPVAKEPESRSNSTSYREPVVTRREPANIFLNRDVPTNNTTTTSTPVSNSVNTETTKPDNSSIKGNLVSGFIGAVGGGLAANFINNQKDKNKTSKEIINEVKESKQINFIPYILGVAVLMFFIIKRK